MQRKGSLRQKLGSSLNAFRFKSILPWATRVSIVVLAQKSNPTERIEQNHLGGLRGSLQDGSYTVLPEAVEPYMVLQCLRMKGCDDRIWHSGT